MSDGAVSVQCHESKYRQGLSNEPIRPKAVGHGSSTQFALVKAPGHCNGHPTFIKQCSNHSYLHSYSIAERIVLTFNADA